VLWFVVAGWFASKEASFPDKFKLSREVQSNQVNLGCFEELNFLNKWFLRLLGPYTTNC